LEWRENYQADWCDKFPDPHASGGFVDVFFNNALVFRVAYVWVDGTFFPLPRHAKEGLEVSKRACAFMELIDSIGRSVRRDYHKYEDDLRLAGFTVVNDEWPKFFGGLEE